MSGPPNVPPQITQFLLDTGSQHSAGADTFGCCVMWIRRNVLQRARQRVENESARNLGSLGRREYDAVAMLGTDQREACHEFAKRCVDDFIQEMLGLLANRGDDLTASESVSMRLRLDLELYDIDSQKLLTSATINRPPARLSPEDAWGRWLNRLTPERLGTVPPATGPAGGAVSAE